MDSASTPPLPMPEQPHISQEERQSRDAERKRTHRQKSQNIATSTDPEVITLCERSTHQRLADQCRLRQEKLWSVFSLQIQFFPLTFFLSINDKR
jgi:hypothetical protein